MNHEWSTEEAMLPWTAVDLHPAQFPWHMKQKSTNQCLPPEKEKGQGEFKSATVSWFTPTDVLTDNYTSLSILTTLFYHFLWIITPALDLSFSTYAISKSSCTIPCWHWPSPLLILDFSWTVSPTASTSPWPCTGESQTPHLTGCSHPDTDPKLLMIKDNLEFPLSHPGHPPTIPNQPNWKPRCHPSPPLPSPPSSTYKILLTLSP